MIILFRLTRSVQVVAKIFTRPDFEVAMIGLIVMQVLVSYGDG